MKSGFVTIIGRPNVGKSTLLNALIGQKISIVTDKPQTTRLAIQGIYHRPDLQIVFVDTPGIHKPKARLGEVMNAQAFSSIKGMDCVILLIDASVPFGKGDEFLVQKLIHEPSLVIAFNKIDLTHVSLIESLKNQYHSLLPQAIFVEISAYKHIYLQEFIKVVSTFIKEGPSYFPENIITNFPEAFHVSELIREKVMLFTREEIPHSVVITIDDYTVENDIRTVYASIIVEKESQKGIVIGKNGAMIAKIRQHAVQDVRKHLSLDLSLELYVKVSTKWRDSLNRLKEFGLS
jgi:GTP-binding protein Era